MELALQAPNRRTVGEYSNECDEEGSMYSVNLECIVLCFLVGDLFRVLV